MEACETIQEALLLFLAPLLHEKVACKFHEYVTFNTTCLIENTFYSHIGSHIITRIIDIEILCLLKEHFL